MPEVTSTLPTGGGASALATVVKLPGLPISQGLGVIRELQGQGKSSDLLEAGGREDAGGKQREVSYPACLWRVRTAPFLLVLRC